MYSNNSAMVYCTLHVRVFISMLLLLFLIPEVVYSENKSTEFINSMYSFGEDFRKSSPLLGSPFTPKTLYTSFGDTYTTDNTVDIKEINVGLGVKNIFKRGYWGLKKGCEEIRLLSFGLTYKNHHEGLKKDQLGFNALLMKLKVISYKSIFESKSKALVEELSLIVLEKKSPIYAKTNIDWISLNLGLGYDPLFHTYNTSVILLPSIGLGVHTLSLDTNLFSGLPLQYKDKTFYGFGDASVRLIVSHKSLSAFAEVGLFHFNSLSFSYFKAGISYTFLKEHTAYFHDVITIFLNLETNNFSVQDDTKTYSKTIQSIRGGLSFRLAPFFDDAY